MVPALCLRADLGVAYRVLGPREYLTLYSLLERFLKSWPPDMDERDDRRIRIQIFDLHIRSSGQHDPIPSPAPRLGAHCLAELTNPSAAGTTLPMLLPSASGRPYRHMHPRPAPHGSNLGCWSGLLYERHQRDPRLAGRRWTARGSPSVDVDVQKPLLLCVPGAFQGLKGACEEREEGAGAARRQSVK